MFKQLRSLLELVSKKWENRFHKTETEIMATKAIVKYKKLVF